MAGSQGNPGLLMNCTCAGDSRVVCAASGPACRSSPVSLCLCPGGLACTGRVPGRSFAVYELHPYTGLQTLPAEAGRHTDLSPNKVPGLKLGVKFL